MPSLLQHETEPVKDVKNRNLIVLESTGSTNTYLKEIARSGAEPGTTVFAKTQTAGRGRLGRRFVADEPGVYMSYLFPTAGVSPELIPRLTAVAGVCVCRAVEKECGIKPEIKWVNDIILNGKKIGGILAEALPADRNGAIPAVVIGIGINTSRRSFPEELSQIAGSVFTESGKTCDDLRLASAIADGLDREALSFGTGGLDEVLEEYRSRCGTVGSRVYFNFGGKQLEGEAEEIDDMFRLVVRLDDGSLLPLAAGEVSVRRTGGRP